MADRAAKVRLFVGADLAPGAAVPLTREQAHYLGSVMRLAPGDPVLAFNGRDGEWRTRLEPAGRRDSALRAEARARPQTRLRDLWLLFAPVRRARVETIVEKAAELGVARVAPVITRRTRPERAKPERLRALMIEAAEQCGGLDVPDLADPAPLSEVLDGWDPARRLLFCDERMTAPPATQALAAFAADPGPWAVLIGPEGGFDPEEAERLEALPAAVPASLGPRILRADTAAIAAVTLWQSVLGDWRTP